VQVGKTADFSTAANLAASIEKRILEAFLVMNVRNAERVTAEEVRLTQLELEKSLGGLFSLLTIEFLVPYLNRTLLILQRSNQIPRLPKDVVRPKIVAGINSLGRGQDNEALTRFIATIAQTLGPEALLQYIDPSEAIKRLAAAQGIDVLNLVRTAEQLQQHKEERMQDMQNKSLLDQAGQLAGTPLMDPQKNPDLAEQASMLLGNLQPPPEE
jgi:ribosomal protein S15P/S13E